MSEPRLPQFIIIGAVKAATTWIAHQLRQHPDIYLPGPEPHYFSTEYHRGIDWYAGLFAEARPDQMIGEKSADYLAHPEAPRRIARTLPDVPLIVQLRNPIERAYSDYCMLYRRGTVGRRPERYLRSGSTLPRFLEDGLYHRHLARFLEYFPREKIEVILHEEIRQQPEAVIARVSRHIGIDVRISEAAVAARVNDGEVPLLPLTLRRLLSPAKDAVGPWRDQPWFQTVRNALARTPSYPPLTDDLRKRLRDYYAADVQELGRMLSRDMTSWLSLDGARR
jgi:hypothetical protein